MISSKKSFLGIVITTSFIHTHSKKALLVRGFFVFKKG
nr:MAG TPA: hypothetical protein [Caudoviricetes sp.]